MADNSNGHKVRTNTIRQIIPAIVKRSRIHTIGAKYRRLRSGRIDVTKNALKPKSLFKFIELFVKFIILIGLFGGIKFDNRFTTRISNKEMCESMARPERSHRALQPINSSIWGTIRSRKFIISTSSGIRWRPISSSLEYA